MTTSRTFDRTTIKARVVKELAEFQGGLWAPDHVQPAVTPQIISYPFQPPFVQVCSAGETPIEYPATDQRRMPSFPIAIAFYADIDRQEWTLTGTGEIRSIEYLQDQVGIHFWKHCTLGGLVDRAWIITHQAPIVSDEIYSQMGQVSLLVAISILEVSNKRPG